MTHKGAIRAGCGELGIISWTYKPIDEVMAKQADLVDMVHVLKQVICVKG